MQIFVQFAGTYLRECSGNKVLWIWVFFTSFFFGLVDMFQSSLNCKSSLKFSSAEFSIEFSFSCLTWYNFSSWLLFNFTFISWKASGCLEYVPAIQEANNETHLPPVRSPNSYFHLILVLFLGKLHSRSKWWNQSAGYFFLPSVWSPNSYWGFNSRSQQKVEVAFGTILSGIPSPFSTLAKSSATHIWLDFFLRN